MSQQRFPPNLQDKIFEIRQSDDSVSAIVSYFPFTQFERREIIAILNNPKFDGFHSIFTDTVTDEEWVRTRDQIKKKFRDELFDID